MGQHDLQRLDGQVALVTGASSGIGRAVAAALASAGARVAINHRQKSEKDALDLLRSICDHGGEAITVCADVGLENEVEAMFADIRGRLGPIDILVANAGIQDGSPFREMSLEQWERVLRVNLTGQFLCARAAIRDFLRPNRSKSASCSRGKIIAISSVHQQIPWAFHANYAASKGGVMLLMQSLAQEHACDGIRINLVAPGAIKTGINQEAWSSDHAREALLQLIPYGRIGVTEDVARAVTWLASDASDYVNGATLYVDGGMTLYPAFRGGG